MKPLLRLSSLAFLAVFGASCAKTEPTQAQTGPPSQTIGGVRIWKDVSYVSNGHARQKLDFYAPSTSGGPGPWPCVIWIHGGGWENGNKDGNGAMGLNWRSYATASIGYRLTDAGPFPAQIEDCKSAIRFLRANAARFNIDAKRIGVIGQSAGGHLAALVGTSGDGTMFDKGENLGQSSRVQAVCDLSGPADFSLYGASRPGDLLSKFFGGVLQDNLEKARIASPVTHVSKDDPPFLIFNGSADPLVPPRHAEKLRGALQKAGVPVSLTILPGVGHALDTKAIEPSVAAFFDKHLK